MANLNAPAVPVAQLNTRPAPVDWVSFLTGEMLVAGLLSKTLYNYPTQDWLQSLADAEVFAESPLGNDRPDVQAGLALLRQWAETAQAGLTPQAVEDLGADYTRLMIGPGVVLAPPWESVYYSEERLVFNEQTSQVRAWYSRFGLEVEKRFQEPDDHIGLELAFVAHLAQRALRALDGGDRATFEATMAAQREFLSKHLLDWAAQWCDLALKHAHSDFFRGIALLAKGALAEIAAVLQLKQAS